jgi:cell division protease FtsH
LKQLYKNVLLWAVILVMFVAFYQFFNSHQQAPRDLTYGEFLTYVDQGRVKDLKIKGQT